MKKYLLPVLTSLLLIGCREVTLDDMPDVASLADGFTLTWTDQGPCYTLNLKSTDGVTINNLKLFYTYRDVYETMAQNETNGFYIWSPSSSQVYTFTDSLLLKDPGVYSGDICRGYVEIYTNIGMFKTKMLEVTVPGTPDPIIDSLCYTFNDPECGNSGTLHIYGHNFATKRDRLYLEFDEQAFNFNWDFAHTSELITLTDLTIFCYGQRSLTLINNGREYPLTYEVKGLHIDKIIPEKVVAGKPLYIYCSGYKGSMDASHFSVNGGEVIGYQEGIITILPYNYVTSIDQICVNDRIRGLSAFYDNEKNKIQ